MDDRRQDDGRTDRSRGTVERDRYGQEQTSQMIQPTEGRETQGRGPSGAGGGDWQGYVVPYRYYGPGYRGVGYYSVMYQGSGSGTDPDSSGDAAWERSGQPTPSFGGANQGGADRWQGRARGGFAGLGPKGYRRSDERLREEISDRLMEDDSVDASDVEVAVTGGEVTLRGTVPDRWMKRRAEDCAEQVMGVRDVMNQLRVQNDQSVGQSGDTTGQGRATGGRQTSQTSQSADRASTAPNGRRPAATSGTR